MIDLVFNGRSSQRVLLRMPRKKAPQATVDQLLDRQPESRATAPVCDYLLHAANSDTTSKSIISVKNFREGLSQMIPLNHLFPIDDLTKPENQAISFFDIAQVNF